MNLLYALESVRTPFWDAVFSAVTHLGEETVFMVAAILIFWCVSKQEGYYLLLMGFFGTVVNQFLKLLFRIPRPWVRDPDFTIVESARAQATGYSFPSGHTQNAVATFGGIARSTRRPWVRWACVAVLLLVSFSRLYLGVHTPLDVGVSFAVAGVMVLTLYPLIRQADRKPSLMAGLIAGMLLVGIAYLVFAYVYPFPADVDAANLAHGQENGWKLLGATVGFGIAWWLDRRYIHFDTRAVWWPCSAAPGWPGPCDTASWCCSPEPSGPQPSAIWPAGAERRDMKKSNAAALRRSTAFLLVKKGRHFFYNLCWKSSASIRSR